MQFSHGRVRQEGDLLYAPAQFVEHDGAAAQQSAAIGGRLGSLRGAVEQPNAEVALKLGDRLRYDRV
jgi:hypothetical protein